MLLKYSRLLSIYEKLNQFQRYSSTYVMKPYSFAFGKSNHYIDYNTIGSSLLNQAKLAPTKHAIYSSHEQITKTYEELNNDVDKVANSLLNDFELKKGDVISLWSANSYNYILILYAAARAGLIVSTLNPAYKSIELEYALVKSGSKMLFLPGEESEQKNINDFCSVLRSINLEATKLESVVSLDSRISKSLNNSIKLVELDNLLKSNGKTNEFDNVNADDPAIIMFTSGTTGAPKGALLSHSNLINNAFLTGNRLGLTKNLDENKACVPVPLFHIFGLVYGSVMMSKIGLPISLCSYKYNVKHVVDTINKQECTHAMIVPTMTIDILSYLEKTNSHLPSLKSIITGSAPTPVEVARQFVERVPNAKQFLIRYGSTETGGCMTMPHSEDLPDSTIDNVGKPLDLVQIKLVDPKTNLIVKLGEQGELWCRGHNVMLGYWNDEEKTKKEITRCKWFKSGDMATMDENGKLKLVGRLKELIIKGGENIYPKEVEEVLFTHPLIHSAAVFGLPHKRYGETVSCWIKLRDSNSKLTKKEVQDYCKDKMAYFKVPEIVMFEDEFPLTPSGKVQKFKIQEISCKKLGIDWN